MFSWKVPVKDKKSINLSPGVKIQVKFCTFWCVNAYLFVSIELSWKKLCAVSNNGKQLNICQENSMWSVSNWFKDILTLSRWQGWKILGVWKANRPSRILHQWHICIQSKYLNKIKSATSKWYNKPGPSLSRWLNG